VITSAPIRVTSILAARFAIVAADEKPSPAIENIPNTLSTTSPAPVTS